MAKARRLNPPPIQPPPTIQLDLTEKEAKVLFAVVSRIGGLGTPSHPLRLECGGKNELNVPEGEGLTEKSPRTELSAIFHALENLGRLP